MKMIIIWRMLFILGMCGEKLEWGLLTWVSPYTNMRVFLFYTAIFLFFPSFFFLDKMVMVSRCK